MGKRNVTIWLIVVVLAATSVVFGDLTDGLVAYYPFNGNANDESGNGNDGIVYGATLTTDRFGNPNSAYMFDGTNDYIDVDDAPELNPTNAITITAWFKADSFALGTYSWPPIVKKSDNDQTGGYTLEINKVYESRPGLLGAVFLEGQTTLGPPEPLLPVAEDAWYFAAFVYDGSTLTNYLLSMDQMSLMTSSNNRAGNIEVASNNLNIGHDPSNTYRYFDGAIDEVRIYNRALSENEISQLARIPILAIVNIDPDTLNLKSNGKWITAYIGLPDGYDVHDIDIDSVSLEGLLDVQNSEIQGSVLMVKFDREDLETYLEVVLGVTPPADVDLVVIGKLSDGTQFRGSDTIRVIRPGGKKK